MTETSYMCVPKVTFLKMVFDNISSRDLNILYFCKKYINRLGNFPKFEKLKKYFGTKK